MNYELSSANPQKFAEISPNGLGIIRNIYPRKGATMKDRPNGLRNKQINR